MALPQEAEARAQGFKVRVIKAVSEMEERGGTGVGGRGGREAEEEKREVERGEEGKGGMEGKKYKISPPTQNIIITQGMVTHLREYMNC